jgi:hypothetical protein
MGGSTSKGTISIPMESFPGFSLTSEGFIVDRYIVFPEGAAGVEGRVVSAFFSTSRIPQIGQSPGLSEVICGCMGQM